ncbi:MAG: VRR-NUC domain-containing protein [Nitrospiraceae bacterium]|nr:VRR-NUC domain-containing protein [Nitrospiraceae bacterium]
MNEREKDVKGAIKRLLKTLGWDYISNLQGIGCRKGVPDITAIPPEGPYVVWIEVKTTKGRLSQEQEVFITQLQNRGQHVMVIKGVCEVKKLEEFLMKHTKNLIAEA